MKKIVVQQGIPLKLRQERRRRASREIKGFGNDV